MEKLILDFTSAVEVAVDSNNVIAKKDAMEIAMGLVDNKKQAEKVIRKVLFRTNDSFPKGTMTWIDGENVSEHSPKSGKKVVRKPAKKVEKVEVVADAKAELVKNSKGISIVNDTLDVNGNVVDKNITPEVDTKFVPFGIFNSIAKIIKAGRFLPSFITGLTGNGKTTIVEQACAKNKREMFRVNITIETDEDDLLGGFRLVDGETVWFNGPVVDAMQRGAVLLLDEIDLAGNRIMCLQPVLEGKGVFIKKINQFVKPAKGFTVFATANTKGQGSDDGKYIGTNVMNEAFLDRFAFCFEHDYAEKKNEAKILTKIWEDRMDEEVDVQFVNMLCEWAMITRETYKQGSVDELITTRRLIDVIDAYSVFGDKKTSLEICLNRFDDMTKEAFLDLYSKLDAGVDMEEEKPEDDGFAY